MLDNQGELNFKISIITFDFTRIHLTETIAWQVYCEEELVEAIETANGAKKDCLCLIEVIVHKDDTSKELLEWGSRVSAANSRPPNPQ